MIGFVEEKQTIKNKKKVLVLIKNFYFTKSEKIKNCSENFFWSGSVGFNHPPLSPWSSTHRPKKQKLELIEDSCVLTSTAASFLWQEDSGMCKKRVMDNSKSLQSIVQAVWAALDLGFILPVFGKFCRFFRCRCSVHLNIENKQLNEPAPLIAVMSVSI